MQHAYVQGKQKRTHLNAFVYVCESMCVCVCVCVDTWAVHFKLAHCKLESLWSSALDFWTQSCLTVCSTVYVCMYVHSFWYIFAFLFAQNLTHTCKLTASKFFHFLFHLKRSVLLFLPFIYQILLHLCAFSSPTKLPFTLPLSLSLALLVRKLCRLTLMALQFFFNAFLL